MEQLLTAVEAAKVLGITPGTLANWRAYGTGPKYVKVGGRVRYHVADVKAYLESRTVRP